MTNYRVISDTHFTHQYLIDIGDRKPGFEFNIYKNLLKIPKEDVLIHLGDVCIGNDIENHELYIKPLECKKVLVIGNHDKKSVSWYLDHGRDFVCDSFTLQQFGKNILFTHIPKPKQGYINIHGHLHKNLHHAPVKGDCILYSCEFENYMPLKLKTLIKRYDKKTKIGL